MTGTPITNNYVLGRGEVAFSPFKDATAAQLPSGYRYIGDTPTFNMSTQTTELDHYNSDHGIKTRDNTVTLQINRGCSFETDNINLDNLALSFFGTKQTNTSATATVTAEHHDGVIPGTTIMLGVDAAHPAGLRGLASITTITDDEGTPHVYASGTDYIADLATGEVYLVAVADGGTIGVNPNTANLRITYVKGVQSFDQVISSNTPIEGSIRFKAFNPVGNQVDYLIPWVKIEPDGDYNLKGDNWQSIKFKGIILDPKDGRAAIYANGRPYTP